MSAFTIQPSASSDCKSARLWVVVPSLFPVVPSSVADPHCVASVPGANQYLLSNCRWRYLFWRGPRTAGCTSSGHHGVVVCAAVLSALWIAGAIRPLPSHQEALLARDFCDDFSDSYRKAIEATSSAVRCFANSLMCEFSTKQ